MSMHAGKIGLPDVEVRKFFDFYDSKGWMVGKNRMTSWTAAMSGWMTRRESERKPTPKAESKQMEEHLTLKIL